MLLETAAASTTFLGELLLVLEGLLEKKHPMVR